MICIDGYPVPVPPANREAELAAARKFDATHPFRIDFVGRDQQATRRTSRDFGVRQSRGRNGACSRDDKCDK